MLVVLLINACPECGRRQFSSCDTEKCGVNGGSSKHCFHIDRTVSCEHNHFSYYPVWCGLLDLFATDNDVFMHSLTRLQWTVNILYDIENQVISSDVSMNTYYPLTYLGETQLTSFLKEALLSRPSPTSSRAFLNPDANHSFNKELKKNSIQSIIANMKVVLEDGFHRVFRG